MWIDFYYAWGSFYLFKKKERKDKSWKAVCFILDQRVSSSPPFACVDSWMTQREPNWSNPRSRIRSLILTTLIAPNNLVCASVSDRASLYNSRDSEYTTHIRRPLRIIEAHAWRAEILRRLGRSAHVLIVNILLVGMAETHEGGKSILICLQLFGKSDAVGIKIIGGTVSDLLQAASCLPWGGILPVAIINTENIGSIKEKEP